MSLECRVILLPCSVLVDDDEFIVMLGGIFTCCHSHNTSEEMTAPAAALVAPPTLLILETVTIMMMIYILNLFISFFRYDTKNIQRGEVKEKKCVCDILHLRLCFCLFKRNVEII